MAPTPATTMSQFSVLIASPVCRSQRGTGLSRAQTLRVARDDKRTYIPPTPISSRSEAGEHCHCDCHLSEPRNLLPSATSARLRLQRCGDVLRMAESGRRIFLQASFDHFGEV